MNEVKVHLLYQSLSRHGSKKILEVVHKFVEFMDNLFFHVLSDMQIDLHVGNVYRHGLPDEDREWTFVCKKRNQHHAKSC